MLVCGLAGILIGKTKKPRHDMATIGDLFTRLLVLSEHRGPHATGAAWLDEAGCHGIHKAPQSASHFIKDIAYSDWKASISSTTVLLMGHTRWPTQGSHLDNRNNHPLMDRCIKPILATHNGHIPQVAHYFTQFGLHRRWGVDSEIIVRLARRHAVSEGINVPGLLHDLSQCEGHIAAVLVWATHPEKVILIRRNRPLFLAWNQRRRLLVYASERGILAETINSESGWHIERMSEQIALEFNARTLPECVPYDLD